MNTTRISRRYHFESAHWLPYVPEGHKCRRMHGHNYEIEVTVTSRALNDAGFVMDFAELDLRVNPLIAQVDHRTLNDIEGLENPTAEIIAGWFLERVKLPLSVRIFSISVYETKECVATISVPD